MTDTGERRTELGCTEMTLQWLLAATTYDDGVLDELQAATEQTCPCCTAAVTRVLAKLAARFSVELHGQDGATHLAEQMLTDCLDDIAELGDEDDP